MPGSDGVSDRMSYDDPYIHPKGDCPYCHHDPCECDKNSSKGDSPSSPREPGGPSFGGGDFNAGGGDGNF